MEKRLVNESEIKMAIQYFNFVTKKSFSKSTKNVQLMTQALELAELSEVRVAMKKWAGENDCTSDYALENFAIEFVDCKRFGHLADQKKDDLADKSTSVAESIDLLGKVLVEMIAKTSLKDIEASVAEKMHDDCKKFIADNYGPIQRKVTFELPDKKVDVEGVIHSQFDTVLKFVQANEPVFLTGPAGSGKNVLCQQIAKVLGLNFYFSNAVTQEYKITGFTDAMGVFHESQFFKAFKNGGLFMLDEMDASIPEVLIILNAAIANRYFDFPAPIGYVEAHKDFRVIAAGNTFGNGADYDYVGRNQLDAASLDRFAQVRIDYDQKIEEGCANGDVDLLNFCRKFRNATKKAGIRTVVSYRAISRMAKLSSVMEAKDLLESCLIKSLELDDLNAISNEVSGCGKYSDGFSQIIAARKAAM